jgi:ATP-dependent DNA ligase
MLLDELELDCPGVQTIATFEDGAALFRVMCDRGLEGVVAKRERDPYRPGERGWVKTKNKATARFAQELAGVTSARRRARS